MCAQLAFNKLEAHLTIYNAKSIYLIIEKTKHFFEFRLKMECSAKVCFEYV